MPRWPHALVALLSCAAGAMDFGHVSPGRESGQDSCKDLAEKACRDGDSTKLLDRAETLASQASRDLDEMLEATHGKEWKSELLDRLRTEGFVPAQGHHPAALESFFEKLYIGKDDAELGPFSSHALDSCARKETSDAQVQANLIQLWASSGGPATSSFEGTLLGLSGSASEKKLSARFREAAEPFKKRPVARRLMQSYDSWGSGSDRVNEARSYYERFASYHTQEHEFIRSQRAEVLRHVSSKTSSVLRLTRLCALMGAMEAPSGACFEALFDSTPEGLLLPSEEPVVLARIAGLERSVLDRMRTSGSSVVQTLEGNLSPELFPDGLPASRESPKIFLEGLLSQEVPPNFRPAELIAGNIAALRDFDLRERLCFEMENAAAARLRAIVNEFHEDLQLSRPFIEKVRSKIYTPETLASQRQQFEVAKSLVSKVAEKKLLPHVEDAGKRARMRSSLTQLGLHVPPPVSELPFLVRQGAKTPTLDLKRFDRLPASKKNFYAMLVEPGMDGLSSINAFYTPEITVGVERDSRNVFIYPGTLAAFQGHPAALMGVWAHEIGHSFGPFQSRQNGHALSSELGPLLSCLKDSHALGMHAHQGEECIADWFSAESMALLLDDPETKAQLGLPEKDFEVARQILAPFCLFMDMSIGGARDDIHPLPRRRINGIYAAHPRIRAALGCGQDPTIPYCSLEGEAP